MGEVINFTPMVKLRDWITAKEVAWKPLPVLWQALEEYGLLWWYRDSKTVVFEYFDMTKPCWVINSNPTGYPHPDASKYFRLNGRSYEYFERLDLVEGYCSLPADKWEAEDTVLRQG